MVLPGMTAGSIRSWARSLSDTSTEWVDFEEIPQYLKDAAVAIEDRRFYTHHGVDWWRTAQAVMSMFTGGDIQGGLHHHPAAHQKQSPRKTM